MPFSVLKKVVRRKKRDWSTFLSEETEKAPRRKPARTKESKPEKMIGTLYARRNKRVTIREAALRKVSIIVTYKKVTTGETKKYEVNPIEWKFRKLKSGRRKVLYVEDKNDKRKRKQIKNFVLRNIKNVVLTDRKFKSRWPVKIK